MLTGCLGELARWVSSDADFGAEVDLEAEPEAGASGAEVEAGFFDFEARVWLVALDDLRVGSAST